MSDKRFVEEVRCRYDCAAGIDNWLKGLPRESTGGYLHAAYLNSRLVAWRWP